MIPQIGDLVIYGRSGKQQDLGADPLFHHFRHEALVTGDALLPVLILGADGIVAEVVRLVDHDEVVVAPVDGFQVDAVIVFSPEAAEIGVGDQVVVEFVLGERIEPGGRLPDMPVLPELLGADDEDPFVAQEEIFDDGKSFEGFSQPDAVREDAPIVIQEAADGPPHAVLLEGKELLPDEGIVEAGFVELQLGVPVRLKEGAEDMEEGQVVDELRGLVAIQPLQMLEHVFFDILNEVAVIPEFIKPREDIGGVPFGIDHDIELDVAAAFFQTEARHREVGTADQGVAGAPLVNVIHFTVHEAGADDGADLHFFPDPCGAIARQLPLLQGILEGQGAMGELIVFGRRFLFVDLRDEGGLSEEESEGLGGVQGLPQFIVGVDGEVGRSEGEEAAGGDRFRKELSCGATSGPVVP